MRYYCQSFIYLCSLILFSSAQSDGLTATSGEVHGTTWDDGIQPPVDQNVISIAFHASPPPPNTNETGDFRVEVKSFHHQEDTPGTPLAEEHIRGTKALHLTYGTVPISLLFTPDWTAITSTTPLGAFNGNSWARITMQYGDGGDGQAIQMTWTAGLVVPGEVKTKAIDKMIGNEHVVRFTVICRGTTGSDLGVAGKEQLYCPNGE